MNLERFHNELAMRLGYERIVNDKQITITVEEKEEPWVILKVQGLGDIKIKASNIICCVETNKAPALQDEIKKITDAVRQAYSEANKSF